MADVGIAIRIFGIILLIVGLMFFFIGLAGVIFGWNNAWANLIGGGIAALVGFGLAWLAGE